MKENIIVNRKLWLDALRGIAIILVVYGHCVQGWTEFFVFTSPVKIPLFFAISGYLFKPRNGNQQQFYKSIFLKLFVPWIVLGMIPFTNPVGRFLDLIAGKPFWFMPCLIVGEIVWFYVHKFTKNDTQIMLLGVGLCILGFVFNHFNMLRYAMMNTAFIVQFFFVLGYLIRRHEDYLLGKFRGLLPSNILVYLLLGFFVIVYLPGQSMDVHLNRYCNIPVCASMIVLGCTSLFVGFNKGGIAPRWLVYVGQNTLLIYMLSGFGFGIFNKLAAFCSLPTIPLPVYGILKASISIIFCCLLALFVNRYIPEIVGKKRIKSRSL